jgi:hypothetical protein
MTAVWQYYPETKSGLRLVKHSTVAIDLVIINGNGVYVCNTVSPLRNLVLESDLKAR